MLNLPVWKKEDHSYQTRLSVLSLFVWILCHINLCRLFNTKSIFVQINSFISNNSVLHNYAVLLSKTFLFEANQFSQTILIKTIYFSIIIVFVYTI